jgi:hypothetical protein
MANTCVYLQEIFDVQPRKMQDFFTNIERAYLPLAKRYDLTLVGFWETVYTQGNHPEAVALWELPNWAHLAQLNEAQFPVKRGDRQLLRWNDDIYQWINKRQGKVLLPGRDSPTLAGLKKDKTPLKVCVHETVTVQPGMQEAYLEALQVQYVDAARQHLDRGFVGVYRVAWRHTENINIWSYQHGWETLAQRDNEKMSPQGQRQLANWMKVGLSLRTDWFDRILFAAPFAP